MPSLAERLAEATPEVRRQIFDSFETEEERQAYARWWDAQSGWRATPATMANHLTKGEFKLWRYTALLGEKFRDAVTGVSPRQIWNLPARYGKTLLASQWGPVWALDRDPKTKIILVSYGDTLADESAIAVRDILREHADVLRADLRRDFQRQDRFVTLQGGGLLGRGIQSGIAGFGASGVVLDDPHKNWQEAHSQLLRDAVDNAYRSVIRLRLETENAWELLVHTRWHEDDQTERLLKRMEDGTGEPWELIRLPAIAERYDPNGADRYTRMPDPLGRAPGEVLEPERFSLEAVTARHLALGSYLSAGLEQQRPAPQEGGEFKRAWWKLDGENFSGRADQWLSSVDTKLKDKESGDFVVIQVWARTGKDCWLLDQLRGQWSQAITVNAIALVTVRWPKCHQHIIENTGYGPEAMASLRTPAPGYVVSDDIAGQLGMNETEREQVAQIRRRGVPGMIPNNPKGSKVVRARAVAPYIEAGDVHLPADAPWLGIFLDELSAFPNAANDDMTDSLSQALARLHNRGIHRTRTYGEELRNTHASPVG